LQLNFYLPFSDKINTNNISELEIDMQKVIDTSFFDWSKNQKNNIQARGLAALVTPQLKNLSLNGSKERARCIWPSGFDNVDYKYISRRVRSR